MATDYVFELNSGIVLKVSDNIGPLNEWDTTSGSDKLIISSGIVVAEPVGLVCTSAPLSSPVPVVTLVGSSWDSSEGDTGDAEIHLGDGTPSRQTWELISVS